MIIGKQFAEKLYSESQYSEKLYSTGNEELDELLERAFCEGYELGQREFGNPQNKAAKRLFEIQQGAATTASTMKPQNPAYKPLMLREARQHRIKNQDIAIGGKELIGKRKNGYDLQYPMQYAKEKTVLGNYGDYDINKKINRKASIIGGRSNPGVINLTPKSKRDTVYKQIYDHSNYNGDNPLI